MTRQDYIEWRRGRAAARKGEPYRHDAPHCWKVGYLDFTRAA